MATGYSPLNDRAQPWMASGSPALTPAEQERARQAARAMAQISGKVGGSATQTARQALVEGAAAGGPGGPMILSEAERELIRKNPAYAIAAIRRAKTGGKRDMSGGGSFREALLGDALQAFLAMQMPSSIGADGTLSFAGDPIGQANQGLADIVAGATNGRGFGGVLRGQAANLMGQDLSGLKDDQIYLMLAAAADTAGLGYGDFAQYAPQNALEEAQNTYLQHFLGGGTTNVLGQPGALNAFRALVQQYLDTR